MNNYLFLTNEGYTYQPDSESIEPDCENAQLIGIASGDTQEDAFKNLINEKKYLRQFNLMKYIAINWQKITKKVKGIFI